MEQIHGSANVNGTRLNFVMAGEGEPVVFFHGLSPNHRMWDEQLAFCSNHFCVIAYDLRGFGASADPQPGIEYSHAADLAALLGHLGIAEATEVGLSLGG